MRNDLAKEAMMINGEYIEDLIDGYQTIKTSGRENLTASIGTVTVNSRDGDILRNTRYPSRVIKVNYVLQADSLTALRKKLTTLNALLKSKEAHFAFNDEDDKVYIGVPTLQGEVTDIHNGCIGEIQINCLDPFKYSTTETQVAPSSGGAIATTYNGTREAHPKFRVSFDEDCGYVAFFDADQHILQFGDPNEIDGDTSITVFKNNMATDYSQWTLNSGVGATDPTDGTIEAKDGYLQAKSYGSYVTGKTGWHGVSLSRTFVAAKDWSFEYKQLFCITQGLINQTGRFYAYVLDEDNKVIAGVQFIKATSGTSSDVNFIVNGKVARHGSFDCNYNNKRTGLPDEAVRTTSIIKAGDSISFDFTGIQASYNVDVKDARRVEFWLLNHEGKARVANNGISDVKFIKSTTDGWEDIPNTFTAGDVLEIDTQTAEVKLNGLNRPDLGQLGNDWEELVLVPGANEIGVAYSDFATPQVTMSYREVFI